MIIFFIAAFSSSLSTFFMFYTENFNFNNILYNINSIYVGTLFKIVGMKILCVGERKLFRGYKYSQSYIIVNGTKVYINIVDIFENFKENLKNLQSTMKYIRAS